MDNDLYHVFPLLPPSLRWIRLGDFGLWGIIRIGYFGIVSDLVFQICKNSCIYILLNIYLFYLLSYNYIIRIYISGLVLCLRQSFQKYFQMGVYYHLFAWNFTVLSLKVKSISLFPYIWSICIRVGYMSENISCFWIPLVF